MNTDTHERRRAEIKKRFALIRVHS